VELARAVRLACASRSAPAGLGYGKQPVATVGTEVFSSHEITWSGSAIGSAPFNSEAVAVGIRGTAGAVGVPGAVGILDRVW